MADVRKPSEKEAEFFWHILTSCKNAPEVDWEIVANKAGLKNGKCAATRYGQIKKAIGLEGPSPTKPRTPRGKKSGSGTNSTPSKVTKVKGKGKKGVKAGGSDDDDDDAAAADEKVEAEESEVEVEVEEREDYEETFGDQEGEHAADYHDAAEEVEA